MRLIILLSFCFCSLAASAQKPYEDNLKLFIAGDLSTLMKDMEAEKDWDATKNKFSLNRQNTELYAATLAANGDITKLEEFLPLATKKYPNNPELTKAAKQIALLKGKQADSIPGLEYEDMAHLKILNLFVAYFGYKNSDPQTAQAIKDTLLQLIDKVSNRLIYFPGQIEYLLDFKDPSLYPKVREIAEGIITKQQAILFPNTIDNFELAIAYRALAIIAAREGASADAESYSKLCFDQTFKMRSFWIEEDIVVYRRILKITSRKTKLGFVLPQFIYLLQDNFLPITPAEAKVEEASIAEVNGATLAE